MYFSASIRVSRASWNTAQIKRVLADHSDRRHSNLDTAAPVIAVHGHHVGSNLVPGDDVAVGHPGQHPDLGATLQGSGSLVGHTTPQPIIDELESVLVLDYLVAIRNDAQGSVVGAAKIDLVARDQCAALGVDILLKDRSIEAGVDESINRIALRTFFLDNTDHSVSFGITGRIYR